MFHDFLFQDFPVVNLTEEKSTTCLTEEAMSRYSNLSVLKEYFKAAENIFLVTLVIVLFIITQVIGTSADFWTAYW